MSEKLIRNYPKERRYQVAVSFSMFENGLYWRKRVWTATALAWFARFMGARSVHIYDLKAPDA